MFFYFSYTTLSALLTPGHLNLPSGASQINDYHGINAQVMYLAKVCEYAFIGVALYQFIFWVGFHTYYRKYTGFGDFSDSDSDDETCETPLVRPGSTSGAPPAHKRNNSRNRYQAGSFSEQDYEEEKKLNQAICDLTFNTYLVVVQCFQLGMNIL